MLAQAMLISIPIYWLGLMKIPASTMNSIRRKIFHFIWAGKTESNKFHLSSWESISWPKKISGWGLLHLDRFSLAVKTKSPWHALTDGGMWIFVIRLK